VICAQIIADKQLLNHFGLMCLVLVTRQQRLSAVRQDDDAIVKTLYSFLNTCAMLNFCFTIFSGMVVRDRSKCKNNADEVFKKAK
jgi:hypothetical protein